jgi:hypothetical protein
MRGRTGLSALAVLLLAVTGTAGCSQGGKSADQKAAEKRIEEQTKDLDDLAKKREARQRELAAMPFDALSQTLQGEAAKNSAMGAEPFNSMAYAEMVKRGDAVAADLTALFAKDGNDLFNLLALRTVSRQGYDGVDPQRRAEILVMALSKSIYFNTWGMPHLDWYDAAQAILDLGKVADPLLRQLLGDKRPAPSWGSEEAAEYDAYQYRVCDYAWALLREIGGAKHGDIPRDPAERDRLIDAIR